MLEDIDCIQDFPQDNGLWWIRWVDRYELPHGRTATPAVTVLLSALPPWIEPSDLFALPEETIKRIVRGEPLNRPEESSENSPEPAERPWEEVRRRIPILTGAIPGLAIGTVFQNGIRTGELPLATRKFSFVKSAGYSEIHRTADESPLDPPEWWKKENYTYSIINKRQYPLGDFSSSYCVVLNNGKHTLVLPCHEVFRSFYAPHRLMALALTSGPWEQTWRNVARPEETLIREDDRLWQVGLRKDIKDAFAPLIGNLLLTEFGRSQANSIYTNFLTEMNGRARIKTAIPFDWDRLNLTVRCISLHTNPDKYLVTEIVRMEWLGPEKIWVVRDNDGRTGSNPIAVDLPEPFLNKNRNQISALDEEPISVNSDEDPDQASTAVDFSTAGAIWDNPPKIEKTEKIESYKYEGSPRQGENEALSSSSPGIGTFGGTDSAIAQYQTRERRDLSSRFWETTDLLDRLNDDGQIDGWKFLTPPRPRLVGNLPTWELPRKILDGTGQLRTPRWALMEDGSRRTALVCEILYSNRSIYWIELEVRPTEGGFRSLLFICDDNKSLDLVKALLHIAVQKKGKWPDGERLASDLGAEKIVTWKHSYGRGNLSKKDKKLQTKSALKTINRFVEGR
jgi:hypothetical protein